MSGCTIPTLKKIRRDIVYLKTTTRSALSWPHTIVGWRRGFVDKFLGTCHHKKKILKRRGGGDVSAYVGRINFANKRKLRS